MRKSHPYKRKQEKKNNKEFLATATQTRVLQIGDSWRGREMRERRRRYKILLSLDVVTREFFFITITYDIDRWLTYYNNLLF